MPPISLAWSLAQDFVKEAQDFVKGFSEKGIYCPDCQTRFRTVMITPTSFKDYRNPHIAAPGIKPSARCSNATASCSSASLPWDDVDVIYLLKRGLSHLKAGRITVVEWADKPVPIAQHEAGQRYQAVFGRGLDWQPLGFVDWVRTLR